MRTHNITVKVVTLVINCMITLYIVNSVVLVTNFGLASHDC